jgi:hypothetical protein
VHAAARWPLNSLSLVCPTTHTSHIQLQIYTIWNYRREALQPVFEAGGEAAAAASEAELALSQVRVFKHPRHPQQCAYRVHAQSNQLLQAAAGAHAHPV